MRAITIVLLGLATVFLATIAQADPLPGGLAPGDLPALDTAVNAACGKSVVVLGEVSTHGDGHAIAFKAELAHRLLAQCGFNAMFWESSFYEFDHLDRLATAGKPLARDQVAAAIGGIWNTDASVQPLIDELTDRANRKQIMVGGVDDIWDMAGMPYTTDVLPGALAARLPASEAATCASVFHTRIYDGFSPDAPDNTASHRQLLSCLTDIRATIPTADRRDIEVIDSLQRYIGSDGQPKASGDAQTEHAMYLNLRVLADRLPAGSKIIVWTATVHGGRSTLAADGTTTQRMGGYVHDAFGDRSLIIAFGAAGGRYGLAFGANAYPIAATAADSVEAQALAGSDATAVYVPPARLKSFGVAPAGLISHSPMTTRDWSDMVDAAVILQEEYPVTHIAKTSP